MWSIESNGGFNDGFCGSSPQEGFVVFRPFSKGNISYIFGLCQECAKS
jgi:hypothetical protein